MVSRGSQRLAARIAMAALGSIVALAAMTAAPPPATAQAPFDPTTLDLRVMPVASGLTQPVFITNAGDGSNRQFIVELTGKVKVRKGGVILTTPFLDLSGQIVNGGEQGLLGLAFHPSFETNRKFYVTFSRNFPGDPGRTGDTVLYEYKVPSVGSDVADPASGRKLLVLDQKQGVTNHKGGAIAFGRDGMLYIGVGDGGGANDPDANAQNLNSMLGKFLRIDVNGTSGSKQYRVPSSNPYVGKAGIDEIWAYGFRNPWRWSFDRQTGDLWIGDVGQAQREEVDRATWSSGAGKGKNYGWRVMEGTRCNIPSSGCATSGKVRPLAEYDHGSSGGCAIAGGYVYRGPSIAMRGGYFYGDWCTGRIWAIRADAAQPASGALAGTVVLDTTWRITSFGEDEAGNLYVVDNVTGRIYRLDTRVRVGEKSPGG